MADRPYTDLVGRVIKDIVVNLVYMFLLLKYPSVVFVSVFVSAMHMYVHSSVYVRCNIMYARVLVSVVTSWRGWCLTTA